MSTHSHSLPTKLQTRFFNALACLVTAGAGLGVAFDAGADPIMVNASGEIGFIDEFEYGSGNPLPPGAVPLLPLFSGAASVSTSFSYDPAAPIDLDPSPEAGQYVTPGTFTVTFPDIGMSFTAAGNLGFSVYTSGEFHANGNVTSHVGDVGTARPFAISFAFFMPVPSDSLPGGLGAWTYGNVHVSFQDIEPYRDIFIGVSAVPEPATGAMLLSGLAAGLLLRRVRPTRTH